jgi:hypothetical protein
VFFYKAKAEAVISNTKTPLANDGKLQNTL